MRTQEMYDAANKRSAEMEKERSLIQDAERIQELTNDRIPFDRACWIALYIQRITSGMSHEDALRLEEEEHAKRGQPSPYPPQSKVGQYISCQYCHKPAGDRQTKENGYCQDCKAEIVSAGHERERLATGHA